MFTKRITIAALILTTACIGVKRAVVVDLSDYPVPPEEVTIFLPDDKVPGDCERMALLAAAGDLGRDFGDLLQKLREDAGDYGANAIHIRFTSEENMAVFTGPPVPFGGMERNVDAVALYCPRGMWARR